jgi:hypothetical protein
LLCSSRFAYDSLMLKDCCGLSNDSSSLSESSRFRGIVSERESDRRPQQMRKSFAAYAGRPRFDSPSNTNDAHRIKKLDIDISPNHLLSR